MCQTAGNTTTLLFLLSFHTLCLIAIDRLVYLKWPLKYSDWITPKRAIAALLAVWVFCTAFSLLPFFGFGEMRFAHNTASCLPVAVESTHLAPNFYYIVLLFAELFPITVTLLVIHVWTTCIARASLFEKFKRRTWSFSKEELRKANTASREFRRSQLCLVCLFGTIFTASVLLYMPLSLTLVEVILGTTKEVPMLAIRIVSFSAIFVILLHSVLEVCMIRDIRNTMMQCFAASFRRN